MKLTFGVYHIREKNTDRKRLIHTPLACALQTNKEVKMAIMGTLNSKENLKTS